MWISYSVSQFGLITSQVFNSHMWQWLLYWMHSASVGFTLAWSLLWKEVGHSHSRSCLLSQLSLVVEKYFWTKGWDASLFHCLGHVYPWINGFNQANQIYQLSSLVRPHLELRCCQFLPKFMGYRAHTCWLLKWESGTHREGKSMGHTSERIVGVNSKLVF